MTGYEAITRWCLSRTLVETLAAVAELTRKHPARPP